MKPKKVKHFATEVELCAAFIKDLPAEWTAYPETADWDILLVRKEDGFQIGVQAKLKCNAHVVSQALEGGHHYNVDSAGPDCRAILVPEGEAALRLICDRLGITILEFRPAEEAAGMTTIFSGRPRRPQFHPPLPSIQHEEYRWGWHEWWPWRRHAVPDYVPDVDAGAPAPIRLTPWKVKAIKLALILEVRGWVARSDFKALALNPRGWIGKDGSLKPGSVAGQWVAGEHSFGLKAVHPKNYEQIKADAERWMPPAPVLPLPSRKLL